VSAAGDDDVAVRAIAAGGDGVATLADGRTVFIPRAAPGDRLRLRALRLHSRFARAEIDAVVEPGPDRVVPPCPHYLVDRCGGCQLMHLSEPAQRAAKARIAGDALRRIAKLDIADPDVTSSPTAFGYRSKVTFTMQQGRMGYHHVHDATHVFDVRTCLIAEPAVQRLHAAVHAAREHLPQDHARVVLRRDHADHLHVIVATPSGNAWTGGKPLHQALATGGTEAVVWWHPEGGTPRAVAGAADPWPATVFEQVHPAVGRQVREAAIIALGPLNGLHAWDLYAGIGDTTSALAAAGATVESVESDRRAVEIAERNGPAGPVRSVGLAEELVDRLHQPAVVVTNPPRTGMDARVVSAIARSGAGLVAYISCDPATLARDLLRLGDSYRLRQLTCYDQFPQTAHLESLAVLERA
jgi:23S rRNA (uracil1939-C5)-methyltransferase